MPLYNRRRGNLRTIDDQSGVPLYARVPTPQEPIPQRLGWGTRDPRGFGVGYDPAYQLDQGQLDRVREETRHGVVPFDEVIRQLDATNLPPQLVQVTYIAKIPGPGIANAQQLIPKNPNRLSLLVANQNEVAPGIVFSFDFPLAFATSIAGSRLGVGIPINAGGLYSEANGSVSINSVFVFCNNDTTAVFPITVCGFEGTLSVAGNKR